MTIKNEPTIEVPMFWGLGQKDRDVIMKVLEKAKVDRANGRDPLLEMAAIAKKRAAAQAAK